VTSYDVSSNPSVVEGESMQSVKNNRRTLVEHWWHCSSDRAQEMRVANEWSAGLKPTVFQKALEVNLESAAQGVGEGTGVCRGMEMTIVWTTMSTTTRFWRRTGRDRRRRRRRSKKIRFSRTMLKSLICWISSTGA
jgi:hypothetical protein